MPRQRAVVQAFTGDGPTLVAIHDVLADLFDLLDERLPKQEGPVPAEPAPARPPKKAQPVTEPAPDDPPAQAEPVEEPASDKPDLPEHPPLAGRGSSATAWAAWAETTGVPVPGGASRDDIISACREAGALPQ